MEPHTEEPPPERLRALTYLVPGLPYELFERITDHLARELDHPVDLDLKSRSSGPMHGHVDPFADGRADIGFLCSPSYLYLRSKSEPSVDLVPAAFAFRDARAAGRPVYFSEVVVRRNHPARSFSDLAGGVWGYNDDCSLSGYFSALQKIAELDCADGFFSSSVRTGSHHASIEATLSGAIDGAAIDSTVLARVLRERPELRERLRVLDSWGPLPIQPVVVRRTLGPAWARRIADALLALERSPDHAPRLAELDLERCVSIDESVYADERRALTALGHIPG